MADPDSDDKGCSRGEPGRAGYRAARRSSSRWGVEVRVLYDGPHLVERWRWRIVEASRKLRDNFIKAILVHHLLLECRQLLPKLGPCRRESALRRSLGNAQDACDLGVRVSLNVVHDKRHSVSL